MKKVEYAKIASQEFDRYSFNGLKRRTAIKECVQYLTELHERHPDGKISLLPIIAKNFYVRNNTAICMTLKRT